MGAFVGLIIGSVLFDKIGRKITTLAAASVCCVSTAAAYFVEDYYTMLALRVLQVRLSLDSFIDKVMAKKILKYSNNNFFYVI